MAIANIDRPASLVEEVCQRLAADIRSGELDDGGWLPSERMLAGQLGVSRPVVREATKRLELQGLVEVLHGVGTKVVDRLHNPLSSSLELLLPDEADRLRQLNEARLAIEPQAARLAAERSKPAQRRAMWTIQERLVAAQSAEEAITHDMAFHRAVADASGNVIFRTVLDSLADLGRATRERTIGRNGKQTPIAHHRDILEAIDRRDAAAAHDAMHRHIVAAGKDLAADLSRRSRK